MTDVPLREHLESLVAALEKRILDFRASDWAHTTEYRQLALSKLAEQSAASKEAVDKAQLALETRLDGLNKLRHGVATTDQLDALEKIVVDNRSRIDRIEAGVVGRAHELVASTAQVAANSKAIADLATRIDRMEAVQIGRSGGLKDYIGWIIAALTVVSAFIGFAVMLRK